MEAFKCQGCEAIVNSDYQNENTNLDYCKLCDVPKVEDLQELDLLAIKQNKTEYDLEFLESYNKPIDELFKTFVKDKRILNNLLRKPKERQSKMGYKCCYCEIVLTFENYTREHVIPKRIGGKIIKPCCYHCNQEKGGLMLDSYIQLLNLKMLEKSGHSLRILQIKIKNANRIAKEIENHE